MLSAIDSIISRTGSPPNTCSTCDCQAYRQCLMEERKSEIQRLVGILHNVIGFASLLENTISSKGEYLDVADALGNQLDQEQQTAFKVCLSHISWLDSNIQKLNDVIDEETVDSEYTTDPSAQISNNVYYVLGENQTKELIEEVLNEAVPQIIDTVSQQRKELAKKRQAEGIAAAKEKGILFGRKPMDLPEGFEVIYKEWKSGALSARKAAEQLGVSHPTFLKWVDEFENMSNFK